jgi:regulator of RNase E activity RraA
LTERDYASRDLPVDGDERSGALDGVATATVADALGLAGAEGGGWIPGLARRCGGRRFVGRAITLGFEPAPPGTRAGDAPFLAIDVIARSRPDDVLVMATGGAPRAFWGEHMAGQAVAAGLAGAILDGAVRDVEAIDRLGFPIFAAGICPDTYLGHHQAVAYNEVVEVGGVTVAPGDLVAADPDGVVVIPHALIAAAERGIRTIAEIERQAQAQLAAGADPRSVQHEVGQSFVSLSERSSGAR